MWRTNLKIVALAAAMIGAFILVANSIPQLQSDVPQELDLSGELSAEALVSAGDQIYHGAGGCAACHGLGTRAPNLLTDERGTGPIGERCGSRRPGVSCKDYLLESLTSPEAYVVPGYQNIMQDVRRTLPMDQVWAVIAYLQSQGGSVDVSPEEVLAARREAAAAPPPGPGPGGPTASLDPREIISAFGCVGCHVLDGAGGPVGPPFDRVGARLTREEIRAKIINPASMTSRGYEAMAGMMPATFGQQLTAAQMEALVAFLAARR